MAAFFARRTIHAVRANQSVSSEYPIVSIRLIWWHAMNPCLFSSSNSRNLIVVCWISSDYICPNPRSLISICIRRFLACGSTCLTKLWNFVNFIEFLAPFHGLPSQKIFYFSLVEKFSSRSVRLFHHICYLLLIFDDLLHFGPPLLIIVIVQMVSLLACQRACIIILTCEICVKRVPVILFRKNEKDKFLW